MIGLKKSLGQNFFNNPQLADKICNLVVETNPSGILEIGPGDGYFTQRLNNLCGKVVAIEKDSSLINDLQTKLPRVQFVNQDFFDVNLKTLDLGDNPVIFGSLPYNVSKHIIRHLLEETNYQTFFFILQKEVAQKYAQNEKSTLQYTTTKLFADSKIFFHISPGSFIPRPKVESSFLKMTRNNNIESVERKIFLELVKKAFQSPRKILKNNFRNWELASNIDEKWLNMRAENLTFQDFITIHHQLKVI